MQRNIEDLVLDTLLFKLVEITGIPSGRIFVKMPDYEFINSLDGNISPATNPVRFPAIGMRYFDKVRYEANTYGDEIIVDNDNGTGILYEPQGEIHLPISIYLFTETRKEQNTIGAAIFNEFSTQSFYELYGDSVTGEYVQLEFSGFSDLPNHRPYIKCFDVVCRARTLNEVSGYLVDYVDVTLSATAGSIEADVNNEEQYSYFRPLPPNPFDYDIDTYFQDWNIVRIDMTDDFGGILERTEES